MVRAKIILENSEEPWWFNLLPASEERNITKRRTMRNFITPKPSTTGTVRNSLAFSSWVVYRNSTETLEPTRWYDAFDNDPSTALRRQCMKRQYTSTDYLFVNHQNWSHPIHYSFFAPSAHKRYNVATEMVPMIVPTAAHSLLHLTIHYHRIYYLWLARQSMARSQFIHFIMRLDTVKYSIYNAIQQG